MWLYRPLMYNLCTMGEMRTSLKLEDIHMMNELIDLREEAEFLENRRNDT